VQTQKNVSQSLILGLILVVLIAFGLGIWLSQRISSPLNHLANVAAEFRHGNLHSPVTIQTSTSEISQLANTLEDARVALEHSMSQLQSEKAWVEHILNSIVEGILTMDNQNRITFASEGIGRIAEQEIEPAIGQKVDQLFLPVEGEIYFSEQLPAMGQQQSISAKLKNGKEKLLTISRAKLVPPEAMSSSQALVIRDVTNEEYIHRLLGDFLANITHEFRTPLAALEASSELMLDNLDHLSQLELKELLVSLNLGIIDLQTLIDNLIEAASIEAGRFKVSRQLVIFVTIVEDALKVIQPLADKYKLKLVCTPRCETSALVLADRRRMVQVLVNLLSNAI
jgi:signal transduction histidine kinase